MHAYFFGRSYTEGETTCQQAVAELRANLPMSATDPTAVRGECYERATGVDFRKSKGWLDAGRAGRGGNSCCATTTPST